MAAAGVRKACVGDPGGGLPRASLGPSLGPMVTTMKSCAKFLLYIEPNNIPKTKKVDQPRREGYIGELFQMTSVWLTETLRVTTALPKKGEHPDSKLTSKCVCNRKRSSMLLRTISDHQQKSKSQH